MTKIKPVLKTVSAAIDGEEAQKNAFRRLAEISRLKAMLPALAMPGKIGKQEPTRADKRNFDLAAAVSNKVNDKGQSQAFAVAIGEAVKCGDARFFEVVAAGIRHAEKQRADGFNKASAHAFLVLVAKLEIEQETGKLPETLTVTKRASEIGRGWFKNMPFSIAGPTEKSIWSKARKTAGLDYLTDSKRGAGNRVSRSA